MLLENQLDCMKIVDVILFSIFESVSFLFFQTLFGFQKTCSQVVAKVDMLSYNTKLFSKVIQAFWGSVNKHLQCSRVNIFPSVVNIRRISSMLPNKTVHDTTTVQQLDWGEF